MWWSFVALRACMGVVGLCALPSGAGVVFVADGALGVGWGCGSAVCLRRSMLSSELVCSVWLCAFECCIRLTPSIHASPTPRNYIASWQQVQRLAWNEDVWGSSMPQALAAAISPGVHATPA